MSGALPHLQELLGYAFRDAELLRAAMTHPSQEREDRKASVYERLEFLGDRVLALLVAEWLYEVYPAETEGELAKRHAAMVNRDCLAEIAEGLKLGECLRPVNADDLRRGRVNMLSDALEALMGAVYLDSAQNLETLRGIVRRFWEPFIHRAAAPQDAKSALQEWAQGRGLPLPEYKVVRQSGPVHAPTFVVTVVVRGFAPVEAEGASKREAEKKAAALFWQDVVEGK